MMDGHTLVEITVRTEEPTMSRATAAGWVDQWSLRDGTRIRVLGPEQPARQRVQTYTYVAWRGDAVSLQRYRVLAAREPLLALMSEVGRPLDATAILFEARARKVEALEIGIAGITATARELGRTGRLHLGAEAGTWTIKAAARGVA